MPSDCDNFCGVQAGPARDDRQFFLAEGALPGPTLRSRNGHMINGKVASGDREVVRLLRGAIRGMAGPGRIQPHGGETA